ncbi:hypothetical protein ZOSMA_42G01180 [Zostera marina]|uniref:Uncharacterized protein n=1 Tax=Zostera marina TaxID=29655 RepID=A0A0K9P279_ZOSMR|nr:hypothetical protein ZOSMA_42G01180 [Zostera marina]
MDAVEAPSLLFTSDTLPATLDILQEHQDGSGVSESAINATIQALDGETDLIPPELLEKGRRFFCVLRSWNQVQFSDGQVKSRAHQEEASL